MSDIFRVEIKQFIDIGTRHPRKDVGPQIGLEFGIRAGVSRVKASNAKYRTRVTYVTFRVESAKRVPSSSQSPTKR